MEPKTLLFLMLASEKVREHSKHVLGYSVAMVIAFIGGGYQAFEKISEVKDAVKELTVEVRRIALRQAAAIGEAQVVHVNHEQRIGRLEQARK